MAIKQELINFLAKTSLKIYNTAMRVPIRKAEKYTYLKSDPNLTEAKFLEIKNKLEQMKSYRPKLSEEVKILSEGGDFSENAGYQLAKGKLRGLNQKILDLENQIKNAIIITRTDDRDTVQLGDTVLIEKDGRKKSYTILGSAETDPNRNIISHNSPLGAALLNHRVNDLIKVKIARKELALKIIEIK
jgi:transcription elongation factor GreA